METLNISLEQIVPSKTNPRKHFDDAQMKELAESIRGKGIINPILVRPLGGTLFEIVAGERRFRAAKAVGLTDIPVIQRELTDSEAMELQVIENLQRADLHPLEEAGGYKGLMDRHGYSPDDIAAKVGKSKTYVYTRLKLLALCAPAKKYFLDGALTPAVALLLARIPDSGLQKQALEELLENCDAGEVPSHHAAWGHIQKYYMTRLEAAPFDTQDAALLPKAGACTTCVKRTGNQKELFADIKKTDVCTDILCFQKKKDAAWVMTAKAAKEKGMSVIEGAEAEKIFSYGYVNRSSGYVDFNSKCYDDQKQRTWKQMVRNSPLPVTLLRDKEGGIHELAREAELAEALKKSGVEIKDETRDEERKVAGKERQVAKLKQEVCVKAAERLVKNLEAYDFKDFLALIAPMVFHNTGFEALWAVAKRRGLVTKRSEDTKAALQKELSGLNEAALKGFTVELLVSGNRWSSWGGFGENFKLVCQEAKVDLQTIEAEVQTALESARNRSRKST